MTETPEVASALLLFVSSLAVLQAERAARGGNIKTEGDSIWWAVSTMSTVGYGDRYPVTTTGRLVAVGLMLAGVGLLGIVTAGLASWLIAKVQDVEAASAATTRKDVLTLTEEVRRLRAELHEVNGMRRGAEDLPDQPGG